MAQGDPLAAPSLRVPRPEDAAVQGRKDRRAMLFAKIHAGVRRLPQEQVRTDARTPGRKDQGAARRKTGQHRRCDQEEACPVVTCKSHIIPKADKPTDLIFRMRQASDGKWKVIDVYYQGSISELTTRRSDFASTLASGGAPALLKKIDALADKLMAGG